jgi:hypothetical protein
MKFTPAAVVAFLALWESALAGGIEVRTHPVTLFLTLALIAHQQTTCRNVTLVSSTSSRSARRPLLLRSPLALALHHLRESLPLRPRANQIPRSRSPVSLLHRGRPPQSRLLRSRPLQSRPLLSRPLLSKLLRNRLLRNRLLRNRPLRSKLLQSKLLQSKLLQSRLLRNRLLRNRPLRSKLLQSKLLQSKLLQSRLLRNRLLRNRPLRNKPLRNKPLRSRLLLQPRATTSLQRPRTRKLSRLPNPSRP